MYVRRAGAARPGEIRAFFDLSDDPTREAAREAGFFERLHPALVRLNADGCPLAGRDAIACALSLIAPDGRRADYRLTTAEAGGIWRLRVAPIE